MEIWKSLLSLLPCFSLALSMSLISEGLDKEPPSESTDLKLVWLDDLTMSLHLPDTTRHTLLLFPASNIPGEPTLCLFSGTMEQDQRSVIAVSGCQESPETDVTIASRLVPGGLVDLVIVNGTTYSIKDDTSSRVKRQLEVRDDDDMVIPPASAHSGLHQMAADSPMPEQVVLETYLRYDNTLLGKFGGSHNLTKQWLSRVVEMARPRLLHSSLNTGLQLQLNGEMKHHTEDIQADETTIYRLQRNPNEKELTSYFGYQLGGGIHGIAFLGTACNQNGRAVNINELYSSFNTEVRTARVWAHELGHNIGMRHDFDASHGGQSGPCNNQGLMSYGNSPDKWSTCSNTDFAAWFRKEGNVCLKPGQNPWHSNGRCGPQNPLTDGRPGQCDPKGNKNEVGPCCSNIGWCGNSDAHCKCQGCTDFRTNAGQNPWHSNGRCGPQNPLTDGRPGQCDPKGNKNEVGPCCSNIGWCGNSDAHCKCQGCTDFRTNAGPCATLYQHGAYAGKSFPIQEGKTPYNIFRDNAFNDAASSIRVKSGCRVQFWEHDISDGKTGTATQDTSYVGNDWNDKISSASCAC